jgi:catechol 2,3-dioxygenase-like lactoylglutathione lyase family enzyme
MITYVTFGANDIAASTRFFEAVLGTLGYIKVMEDHGWLGLAMDGNIESHGTVWIGKPFNGEAAKPSNGTMIGFAAKSRDAVNAFHAAALSHGGTCEGPPGLREIYGPDFYVAYVRDPVGNKMSVKFQG